MDIRVTESIAVNGSAVAAMTKDEWMEHGREKGIGALNGPEEQTRILEDAYSLSVAAHPELVPVPAEPKKLTGTKKQD